MALFPILSKPVSRKLFDFVDPTTCVDVWHGEEDHLISVAIHLIHGANYNDPAVFQSPGYQQVMRSGAGSAGY
ncbi:cyanobactin biosynthesis system PatB/AcyB/McaB family protein [Pseudophaeobacter sp.]|uniref:cyanobactin biosynthesis system PatB/AcyB/McaB family protein n=1 Tax=Pseudophaeobacter sp. TaxID=1971739 RepID=UPI004058F4FE